jgi:hypothetical protein
VESLEGDTDAEAEALDDSYALLVGERLAVLDGVPVEDPDMVGDGVPGAVASLEPDGEGDPCPMLAQNIAFSVHPPNTVCAYA